MKNLFLTTLLCLFSLGSFSNSINGNDPVNLEAKAERINLSRFSNRVILEWNLVALEAMGGPTYELPLVNSRINAMMHIAMHDAINAIAPMYERYAYFENDHQADPIAAAASAAHAVLVVHFPDQLTMLDQYLTKSLSEVKHGKKKTAGIAVGKAAAEAILAVRADDGAFENPIGKIEPSNTPGVYRVVPPFDFAYGPFWANMQPFGLEKPDQFRSAPNPTLNSKEYEKDFEEVKKIGRLNSTHRTEDQTFTAKFWYELSEMGWNKVARIASETQKLDLPTTARLFALLDMALADSYIAGWDSKYYYNFWRPYTAIRASNDGNENTESDKTWESSEPTPPVPDYPSTHSALGNAAATVLTEVIGDDISFTMQSTTAVPADVPRTFASFMEAADENAESRVLAGIHFRSACKAGQMMGNDVGEWIMKNNLRPLKAN